MFNCCSVLLINPTPVAVFRFSSLSRFVVFVIDLKLLMWTVLNVAHHTDRTCWDVCQMWETVMGRFGLHMGLRHFRRRLFSWFVTHRNVFNVFVVMSGTKMERRGEDVTHRTWKAAVDDHSRWVAHWNLHSQEIYTRLQTLKDMNWIYESEQWTRPSLSLATCLLLLLLYYLYYLPFESARSLSRGNQH